MPTRFSILILLTVLTLTACSSREDEQFTEGAVGALSRLIRRDWCVAISCSQFKGEIVKRGKSKGVDSYIMKLKFVGVLPDKFQNICIFVHFTYEKYSGYFEDIVFAKPWLKGDGRKNYDCSLSDKFIQETTFEQYVRNAMGYVGDFPD